jgi:DNA modification methylase
MTITLHEGDCLAVIPQLVAEGVVVDAVITDPPYHLQATVKRFANETMSGNTDIARRARKEHSGKALDDGLARMAGGFMGQCWDGGDIAFRPETWATIATVLRPGGFLLAFGGTRTSHRLVCAIEDAGFVIQDTIAWIFGSGFPKRRDMLKPAFEPICVAYKPGGKRMLQVDECRIGYEDTKNPATNPLYRVQNGYRTEVGSDSNGSSFTIKPGGDNITAHDAGRWPANVCHDGSDEVLALFPDSAGQQGDIKGTEPSATGDNGIYGHFNRVPFNKRNGEASAERRYTDKTGFALAPGQRRYDRRRTEEYWGAGGGGFKNGRSEVEQPFVDSAARFFYTARSALPCALCGLPFGMDDGMLAKCSSVYNAGTSSPRQVIANSSASVLSDAQDYSLPENADSLLASLNHVSNAETSLSLPHRMMPDIAPNHAEVWPLPKIVQNVRSAAHLCGSCATAIARALAVVRRTGKAVSSVGIASITDVREIILIRSLASYVVHRESTDIILTTTSLKELFGSVFHAIDASINSVKSEGLENTKYESKRLFYHSKADKEDRWGSKHPTVKPVELLKWLVPLVTPKGGTFLDPFAGSGTAAVAALATGRNAILIEQSPDYCADTRARIAHYQGDGQHSLSAKARHRQPSQDKVGTLL